MNDSPRPQSSKLNPVSERFYSGLEDRVRVREGEHSRQLDPRLDLDGAQPAVFKWGREGEGSTRLAVALLADALDDGKTAVGLAAAFTARVVVRLPERWTMSKNRVLSFVDIIRRESFYNVSFDDVPFASSTSQASSVTKKPSSNSKPDIGER